jgi:hypothetical protein
MAIDSLEAIPADGITQWIRVRGTGASNPVLVLIQQGPGLPMINEARRFRHLLKLDRPSQSSTGTSTAAAVRCAHRRTGPTSACSR